jgi:hypothetical protein
MHGKKTEKAMHSRLCSLKLNWELTCASQSGINFAPHTGKELYWEVVLSNVRRVLRSSGLSVIEPACREA